MHVYLVGTLLKLSSVIHAHWVNVCVLKTINKDALLCTNPKVFYNILYPNLWTTNIILQSKNKTISNILVHVE